ncbi:hypothetical protein KEM52_002027 [Ascosphaera acerosa]|nr:hypothetical protein KEM52_002027 [Ascosphaera acerosa]
MKLYGTLLTAVGLASLTAAADPRSFDADDVSAATRKQWCISQRAACPLICTQLPGGNDRPKENDCDDDDLSFSCVCNNGQTPNATEYSQTIPYYICSQQNDDCVKKCPNNNGDCQYRCRADNPCGAKSPTRFNSTTTTLATGTATATATGDAARGKATGTGSATAGASASATTSGAVFTGMAGQEDESSAAVRLGAGAGASWAYAAGVAVLSVLAGAAVVA